MYVCVYHLPQQVSKICKYVNMYVCVYHLPQQVSFQIFSSAPLRRSYYYSYF